MGHSEKAKRNSFAYLLLLFLFIVGVISISNKGSAKNEKDNLYEPSPQELKLVESAKLKPGDETAQHNLAFYYFNLANEFDIKYLFGTPKHFEENQDKAIFYSAKAVDGFKKVVTINDKNATAFAKLAESYGLRMKNGGLGAKLKFMGDFNSNLKKALEIDPQNFEALVTKAYKTLYTPSMVKNRYKAALSQFEKLLENYPDNPDVNKGISISQKNLGKTDKAYEFIKKTLSVKPGDLEAISLKEEIEKKIAKEQKKS